MKVAAVAEIKARFSEYVRRAEKGPVIITRNGRAVAAIVSTLSDEDELERFILANTPRFVRMLEKAEAQIRKGKTISHEELIDEMASWD